MSASASGLNVTRVRFRPVPRLGRRSTSSERAKPKTSTGRSRTQSTRCSRKSRSPSSASCRSSTSSRTGLAPGESLEEASPAGEQLRPGQLRAGGGQAEEGREPGGHEDTVGLVVEQSGQRGGELVLDLAAVVVLADAEAGADDLGQRPERGVLAEGGASAAVPVDVLGQPVDVLLQLPPQPRLADTGRTGDQHQARASLVLGRVQHVLQEAELDGSPDEGRLQAVRALGAADARDDLAGLPQRLRLGLALQLDVAVQVELDGQPGQPPRGGVDQDRAGRRRRLHPRGGVDGVAGDHRLALGAHGGRHRAGHHAGPRREARGRDRGSQVGNLGDELHGRPDRTLGVALDGHGSAPDRHHRVADELLDRAAVPGRPRCGRCRSTATGARGPPRDRVPRSAA